MTPISHVVGPCLHLCTIMNYNLKHHLLHVNTSIMEGSTHDAFENASMDITPDLETPARRVYENPNYINYILHPSKPAPHSAPQTPQAMRPTPYPHLPNSYVWPPYSQPCFETPIMSSERGSQQTKDTGEKRAWRTVQDKLEEVLSLLNSYSWTLGDLLWNMFAMQDKKGREFQPSLRHYQVVTKFLTGETSISVSKILELWMKSPYGGGESFLRARRSNMKP
jgi:hypothetical protein